MYSIIADSCCDMTPELRQQLGVRSIPLTMKLGDVSYTDDENMDIPAFMEEMKQSKKRVASAAPSPDLYREAFVENSPAFGITLSGNLSGSYQSAVLGQSLAEEEGAEAHVFDSKSASAGEVLAAITLRKFIDMGLEKLDIVHRMEQFITQMKTFFVLDHLENLMRNGRLNMIAGKIISILGIKLLLGSDGNGNIELFGKTRGMKKALAAMADTVEDSRIDTTGRDMVITHCDNQEMAEELKGIITDRFDFNKIWIVPTGGLSSMYADEKGLIMAY